MKVLKDLAVSGQITVGQLLQSSIDTDKFIVSDGGVAKFRTGSQLLGDIDGVINTRTITINGTAQDLTANRSWTVGDVRTDSSYANPAWITSLAWSKITGAPAFLTAEADTLATVTGRGATTTSSITAGGFVKSGGTSSQFLKADGSVDSNTYLTSVSDVWVNTTGDTMTGQLRIDLQNTINTTTPGTGTGYGLHFGGQSTADSATGITFSAGGAAAANANAGIYVQGSGSYGTKMYIATTDSYATGAKTAISIDHMGLVNFVRVRPQFGGSNLALASEIPTNLNQLTNGPGYITSYTETDTLATVTGRGNNTTTRIGVTTSSPINFATAGNSGTWIGGIQDGTSGWSISNNGIGFKADDTTYAGIVLGSSNGILYFGRTQAGGAGTMTNWLQVNSSLTATFSGNISAANLSGTNTGDQTLSGLGGVPTSRTLTINGTSFDLSANRSWTISVTEADTLATVTSRGSTTSTALTLSGRVTFGSAIADRPQMPGGILGLDTGDGNFDIWGISRDYYPSHATAANAWGILWNGDNNQIRFIGAGSQRLVIDLDGGSTGALTWEGNNIWHAGNLTNLNQLSNGPGYITSSALNSYLPLSGGTMSGFIQLSGNQLRFDNSGVRSWNIGVSGGNLSVNSGDGSGSLLYNGRPLRDSYYRTYSGSSDYYTGGTAGWYRVAEITLTGNCSGAVIYGTLYDNRYDGADTYQIAVVARAECDFTSNNESHYINVGCTILGSTNYTSYQSKIRVVLSASSAGSRTYELQFYESPWNHDTWQLESTGWTIYTSPQAPRAAVGTARVNYISNQNADYIRANTAVYSPIYYDSSDAQYYLNGNTSGGWRVGTPTGYLDFGPLNADYCHFQTDRTKFYFNRRVEVDGELHRYGGSRFVENTGTWSISITGNAATATNASTVTNGVYTNTNNSLTAGNRIVIQNSQDGGNTRGIFMWNSSDANWGIYMAQSGASKALNDGTAPTGIDGRTEHAIRFRVAASTTQPGFIWENSDNNALMQLQPNTGNLYTRGQIYAGNSTSNLVLHSGNYTSYAPSLTGTNASGTWAISISGNAATASSASSATNATNALRIVYADGPRNLSDRLPNSFTRTVNWDFVTAGTVGGTGNYAGVMTYNPWDGTTASTGDSSYQLAFMNGSGQNGSGLPALRLRKGIDTTWGSWYTILNDGNYTNYAPNINGGSTIGGITYFSNGESINLYGIRGRYTNEYMHLYNKVGIGHPSGWGQGEGNTPNQGLSTYGGINVAYGTNAASTFNGNIVYAGGIGDTGYRRFQDPGGGSYTTQTSVITGAIRIKMPTQGSAMMITCTVKVYEYTTNKSFTITFGGHRDSNNWYNEFCYLDGGDARGELTVRFGVDGGKDCVYIGETNTSWSYPQVFVTDFQMGYTGYSASWLSGWEVGFVTSFATVNRTQTAYRKLTPANYSSYAVPISGGINMTGNIGMNDQRLYLRTHGDLNHYLWNAADDWEELNAYEGTGFRITSNQGGTGVLYVYGASNGGYTYSPYSFRAPIFYDSQDTFYYVDPNGTSRLSRVQPLNLGGATLQFRSTDLAVDSGSREAVTFIDGSQVQAHVSTGTGCGGCCYNWWSSESIQVDAEKDYEFHVWVRSTGNDNVYLGWWEGDTSGNTITSNPYFHTGPINTGGTWVKLTAKLKNWRTASGQPNNNGQDRYASANNMSNDLTGTVDGVMHSNTRFVHIRLGTCYGTVSGSKTYFYGAQVREAGYDDYQQNIVIPYYNGSSWGGKLRFGYNDWGYFGIGMYGAAGEFRMSSDSGDLNLRVDGWIRSESSLQAAGSLTVGGVSTLNSQVYINRHIDANTGWGNASGNTIFVGWSGGKVVLGNNANGGHDYARDLTTQCVVSTNPFFCYQDITAYSDGRVKENVEVVSNAIDKIKLIRGVTYTRSDSTDKEKRHAGVIAQEVLNVLPEVVSGSEDSVYSVAYGNMSALFIEAIKEQQKQIEELKSKLDAVTK